MPGLEVIHPSLHLEAVESKLRHGEGRSPAVASIAERQHGNLAPLLCAFAARQQASRYLIVAVGKNIRLDTHLIPHRALGGKPPAIDRWSNAFNNDPPASILFNQCHRLPNRLAALQAPALLFRSAINRSYNWMVCSAIAVQLKVSSTRLRPASPKRRQRPGSLNISLMRTARSRANFSGLRGKPVT